MQIDKKEKYTLVSYEKDTFSEFYNAFIREEKKLVKQNIIIQISKNINVSTEEILLFLDKAIEYKENGTSFVVICEDVDIDNFPENFNIVPTLQEAEDVIDMESMERELGF